MTEHNTKITISCDKDTVSELTDMLSQHFDIKIGIEIKSKNKPEKNISSIINKADVNKADVETYLKNNGMTFETIHESILTGAAFENRLNIIEWFAYNSKLESIFNKHVMNSACSGGHIDIVRWLYEHKYKECYSPDAINVAACHGRLDILHFFWSKDKQVDLNTNAVVDAARNGHLEVLKFIFTIRQGLVKSNVVAINFANLNGHQHIVSFLKSIEK